MRVLLAQGETTAAQEAEEMLRAAGLDCDTTTSGRQAVALALQAGYDLIVLDRKLQDIDGYEVLRRLHAGGVVAPVLLQSVKSASLVGLEGALDDRGYLIAQVPAEDLGVRIVRLAEENRRICPAAVPDETIAEVYDAGGAEVDAWDPKFWDFERPEAEQSDAETPEVEPWFLESSELESPELESPELESPEPESPEPESPEPEAPEPKSPEPESPEPESPEPESPKVASWQAEKPLETVDGGFPSPPRVGLADLLGTSARPVRRVPNLDLPAFSGARKPSLELEASLGATADPAADSSPGNATAGHDERRRNSRVRTIKSGQIIYNNASCVMDCLVLNLSDGGATLQPQDVLPAEVDRFRLKIQSDALYECHVCWRSGQKVGVAFAA
jgi:CheY-like chemotaxis protein